jgi:lysophospholipase L1-like esterase
MSDPGNRRRRLAQIALSIVVTLMAVGALELAVRIARPNQRDFYNGAKVLRPSARPGQRHELIPNSVNESYIGVPVRINSLGLRDREISLRKHDGTFRILALGDSITFGFGVRLEDTYVKRLEARLQRSLGSDRLEVINTGIEATGFDYYASFLMSTGAQMEPDLVLVGIALNDIRDDSAERRRRRGERGWVASSMLQRLNDVLRARSQLYFTVYADLKSFLYRTGIADINAQYRAQLLTIEPPSPRQERAWQTSLPRLDAVLRAGRALKVPIVLVVFPLELQLGPDSRDLYRRGLGMRLDEAIDYDAPQRRLTEYASAQGVPLIDLLPRFRQQRHQRLFLRNQAISHDWAHPSAAGHDLAAEEIHRELLALGVVPVVRRGRGP